MNEEPLEVETIIRKFSPMETILLKILMRWKTLYPGLKQEKSFLFLPDTLSLLSISAPIVIMTLFEWELTFFEISDLLYLNIFEKYSQDS